MFVETMKKRGPWPDQTDLHGATMALARIQTTYMLPTMHLANGILWDVKTSAILSVPDLVYLGRNRVESEQGMWVGHGSEYALGIEWMESAYR